MIVWSFMIVWNFEINFSNYDLLYEAKFRGQPSLGASEIVSQHCKRFTSWTKVDIFFILTIRTKNEGLAMKNNNLFGIFQPLIFPFSSSSSALVKCSHGHLRADSIFLELCWALSSLQSLSIRFSSAFLKDVPQDTWGRMDRMSPWSNKFEKYFMPYSFLRWSQWILEN